MSAPPPPEEPLAHADMETPMEKLIQICASRNDLFGLAGDGTVYQYNFNSNSWMKLGREWGDDGGLPRAENRSTPKARSATPPPRR